VKTGKYDFNTDEWIQVSEDAKNMIRRLLEKDPKKRYSAEEAL